MGLVILFYSREWCIVIVGQHMRRLFHKTRQRPLFSKKVGPWQSKKYDEPSPAFTEAAQKLREHRDSKQALLQFVRALPAENNASHQYARLIKSTMSRISERITHEELQQIFRAVIDSDSDLATSIYVRILRSKEITREDRIENGRLYFGMLQSRGLMQESKKLVAALFNENGPVTGDDVHKFLDLCRDQEISEAVFYAMKPPSASVLQRVLGFIPPEKVIRWTYLENPHFGIFDNDTLVIALDAMAERSNDQATGRSFLKLALPRLPRSLENLELLVLCCISFGDSIKLGDSLVAEIKKEPNLVKESWDTLAQWSVYSGRDVMEVLKHHPGPDPHTLYLLLSTAVKSQRSEAEIKSLLDAVDCEPDAACFDILINRHIQAVEIEKARFLFVDSMAAGADWLMDDEKYLGTLNRLIQVMAETPGISAEIVFDTYQRVRSYSLQLEYPTQVALLRMFFARDIPYDIGMFLREQFGDTPALPFPQYRDIYDVFFDKIMGLNDYVEAWALYGMLNATIVLPYESYYPIQRHFCELGRPDAAHLIFRHLRNRAKREGIPPPGREMYLMLFAEYGRQKYGEGLRELLAYFKMDLTNDLDIEMMNSMLAGFASLGDVPRVSNLWMETRSFGADNNTITIMLRHLAYNSLAAVDDLWAEFPAKFGLKPSVQNLEQYIIANCYHGYYTRALEITKQAPELYGVEVSPELIEALYNYTLIEAQKSQIREWAKKAYPDIWQGLLSQNRLNETLLPPNPHNDSEAALRAQTISELNTPKQSAVALHTTTDPD